MGGGESLHWKPGYTHTGAEGSGLNEMRKFWRGHCQRNYFDRFLHTGLKFHEVLFLGSNQVYESVPRWQIVLWTHDNLFHWRIYASLKWVNQLNPKWLELERERLVKTECVAALPVVWYERWCRTEVLLRLLFAPSQLRKVFTAPRSQNSNKVKMFDFQTKMLLIATGWVFYHFCVSFHSSACHPVFVGKAFLKIYYLKFIELWDYWPRWGISVIL